MDSLITAAARALAAGDLLGALKRVALRDDPPALALRGIAMAQLGELGRAKVLIKSATRAFGPKEAVARARCVVAEAEIALVSRDLGWPAPALDAACKALEAHGDMVNAAHARNLAARRLLLIGRLDEAERVLSGLAPSPLPPASRAGYELTLAGIAVRFLGLARSMASPSTASTSGSPQETGSMLSIRKRARSCARSTSPRMQGPPSMASTSSRSPRIASTRSLRKPVAYSPPFPRQARAATPDWPGQKGTLWIGQHRPKDPSDRFRNG